MGIAASQHEVTNTASRVDTAEGANVADEMRAVVVNNQSSVSIFLGGSDVTTGDGFELEAGASLSIDLERGDALYAIAGSAGPHRLDVLAGGVA